MQPKKMTEEFKDKDNWSGGPVFELTLVFEKKLDGTALNELLLQTGKFSLIEGSSLDKRFNSIFQIAPNIRLPVRHSFHKSTHRRLMYIYSLGIRPKPFENLVGAKSESIGTLKNDIPPFDFRIVSAFL